METLEKLSIADLHALEYELKRLMPRSSPPRNITDLEKRATTMYGIISNEIGRRIEALFNEYVDPYIKTTHNWKP